MKGICGANCSECELLKKKECEGCEKTNGCPFGKKCFIANYISIGGIESYQQFKEQILKEINELQIEGMPKVEDLYPLNGSFINMEYSLPNQMKVKFLQDNEIYLGNQVECIFNDESMKKCFGLVGNMDFILICEYEEDGQNPEIILYERR